jgi:ornithine cyclodeaminase/alanine dehydrogenase-like protein (mu-crystallin family)
MNRTVRYLSRQDVRAACAGIDTVAAVREAVLAHGKGEAMVPAEACLRWITPSGAQARSLNMPGYVGGAVARAGTKIINANPANPDNAIPRASGICLLFDPETAQVVCIMDATYISATRTASVTVLAAQLLGPSRLERAAVLGAGELASAHAGLMIDRLDGLRTIDVFDIARDRAEDLCATHAAASAAKRVRLRAIGSARAAVQDAQLVVTTTTATEPYIQHGWLSPGVLIVNVSLDDVCAETFMAADHLLVDDWELIRQDDRRLMGRLYREGKLVGPGELGPDGGRAVDGTLGDLVRGRYDKPRAPGDIVMLNPFGMAIEDIVIAVRVYEAAESLKMGVELLL